MYGAGNQVFDRAGRLPAVAGAVTLLSEGRVVKRDVVDAIESLLAHRTEDLGCYEFVLEAWMEEAASEIKRLRSERRWIPVSERLPNDDCRVLCWDGTRVSEVHFHARAKESDQWYSFAGHESPSHWMPLPEPPAISQAKGDK